MSFKGRSCCPKNLKIIFSIWNADFVYNSNRIFEIVNELEKNHWMIIIQTIDKDVYIKMIEFWITSFKYCLNLIFYLFFSSANSFIIIE